MATRSDPRQHRPHPQQQQHQQHQQHQQQQQPPQDRYTQASTPQVYTLYPDPPLRQSSIVQLPPSPSQVLPKGHEKSKSANKASAHSNKTAQPTVSTHSHNASKYQPTSPPSRPQQQQLYSPSSSSKVTLPSPISPSSGSAPVGFAIRDVNATTDPARYEKSQYQHPRQTQPNRQHAYQQTPVMEPVYGGTVPRQTGSSVPAHKHAQGGHDMPKQQSFSASSVSLAPSASSGQYQNGLKQNASISASPSNSPRPGQLISPAASPRNDQPALLPDIPSSSFSLSFERDLQEHEKLHQQQALQYQQRLKQKPPKQSGEDTDDDSDSGSILSYRRSVHRMSMTYKGRPGVPNVSLFTPSQRPQIVQYSRSPTGSPSKEQQEEKQLAVGKGATSNHQQDLRAGDYASGSSLASIDQHRYQGRLDEDGRPRTGRSNTANNPPVARYKDLQIPERSVSADDIYKQNNGGRQPRQHPTASQHSHWKDHPYPVNHHPYPDTAASSSRPTHLTTQHQYEPRPSHESAQSVRSQYTRPRPEAYGHSGASEPSRSMSPTRAGGSDGFLRHPVPSSGRVGAGPGYDNSKVNNHPAHHVVKGGHVRPEEAMGPSNPMPERAEDYVRQGIESHESGDLTKATNCFRNAAEYGDPVGMLMYGLSVRHGWGCAPNRLLAFQYLQKSAEHAVGDLNSRDSFASTAAKGELVLAIYELGVCFRHGWGVEKNKKTAAYYFEIAANLVGGHFLSWTLVSFLCNVY